MFCIFIYIAIALLFRKEIEEFNKRLETTTYFMIGDKCMYFTRTIGRYKLENPLMFVITIIESNDGAIESYQMEDRFGCLFATGKNVKELVSDLESTFEYYLFGFNYMYRNDDVEDEEFTYMIYGFKKLRRYITSKRDFQSIVDASMGLFKQVMKKYGIPDNGKYKALISDRRLKIERLYDE